MFRSAFRNAALPIALLLLGLTHAVDAQELFLPKNTTVKTVVPGTVYVGYASQSDRASTTNPTSPTVRLIEGGRIVTSVIACNHSTIILDGGNVGGEKIGGFLFASDSSKVLIRRGRIYKILWMGGSSTVTITGGRVGGLNPNENSTINVKGGSIGGLTNIGYSTTVNISGGDIGALHVYDHGAVNLFGANLKAKLESSNIPVGNYLFSQYTLFGTLSDGTIIDGETLTIQNDSQAKLNLIKTHASLSRRSRYERLRGRPKFPPDIEY